MKFAIKFAAKCRAKARKMSKLQARTDVRGYGRWVGVTGFNGRSIRTRLAVTACRRLRSVLYSAHEVQAWMVWMDGSGAARFDGLYDGARDGPFPI